MAKKNWNKKKSKWVTYATKYIRWKYGVYLNSKFAPLKSSYSNGYTLCSLDAIPVEELPNYCIDDTDTKIEVDSIKNLITIPRTKKIVNMVSKGYQFTVIAKKLKLSPTRVKQLYDAEIYRIKKELNIMKKLKVYIAGPMKDKPDLNRQAFKAAETYLTTLGHEAINPHNITKHLINPTIEQCIKLDLSVLLTCDAIHMLDGWKESKGATLEYSVAKAIGLKIV